MLIDQFHIEYRQALDRLDSSNFSDLLVEQVDYMLNEGIQRYTKLAYKDFEVIQKRTDDLRSLVFTEFPSINSVTNETNIYSADLSTLYTTEVMNILSTNQYWFYLRCRARLVKTDCVSTYVKVRIYQHDDIDEVLEDPFKRPTLGEVIGYFENNKLYIVTDGSFSVDKVKLTYLKKPNVVQYGVAYPTPIVNIECDLPEHTHKEIIQLAVIITLENLESARLNTVLGMKTTVE